MIYKDLGVVAALFELQEQQVVCGIRRRALYKVFIPRTACIRVCEGGGPLLFWKDSGFPLTRGRRDRHSSLFPRLLSRP